ncbi:hypothetical protein NDU88_005579 [Pleurodeles waltl]|uniref:Uncharacterized protein n=1 Tax=Pleurodeles waltl TaxID=8319 RepID=A0AAV7MBD7_PLEWA|nr:hypothetical protein NDU88_005579 [Pleurodeles waltl]
MGISQITMPRVHSGAAAGRGRSPAGSVCLGRPDHRASPPSGDPIAAAGPPQRPEAPTHSSSPSRGAVTSTGCAHPCATASTSTRYPGSGAPSGLLLVKAAAGRRKHSVRWPLRPNAVLLSCHGVKRQFSFRSFRPGLVRESGRGVCGGPARCGRTGELLWCLAAIQPA